MRKSREAYSLIEDLLQNRSSYFSKGALNSEGRKLVARLLKIMAELSPRHFARLKRLYPFAAEERWVEVLIELREELLQL
ncbi:MAG: hypothetical protein DRJ98_08250 [Thermoprotei archaeon]|nr:MAG: hypothetical protein DRJ98_08250 [Thermoprotei archaeon]